MELRLLKYLILLAILQSCTNKPTKVCWTYVKNNNAVIHDNERECYVEPTRE